MTFDGSTVKMYVNGRNVGTCNGMGQRFSKFPVAPDLFIGKAQWADPHPYLNAELGCFRVYNRVLRSVRPRM